MPGYGKVDLEETSAASTMESRSADYDIQCKYHGSKHNLFNSGTKDEFKQVLMRLEKQKNANFDQSGQVTKVEKGSLLAEYFGEDAYKPESSIDRNSYFQDDIDYHSTEFNTFKAHKEYHTEQY